MLGENAFVCSANPVVVGNVQGKGNDMSDEVVRCCLQLASLPTSRALANTVLPWSASLIASARPIPVLAPVIQTRGNSVT